MIGPVRSYLSESMRHVFLVKVRVDTTFVFIISRGILEKIAAQLAAR